MGALSPEHRWATLVSMCQSHPFLADMEQEGTSHLDEIFLGGSCNPTTWRKDVAIPLMEERGVSFYNPQVEDWSEELLQLEADAKAKAAVLLFVIDGDTRAMMSMLEVIEYIAVGRAVALAVVPVQEGQRIDGEEVGPRELKDLNRARRYVLDAAERRGIEVRRTIEEAVQDAIQLVLANRRQRKRSRRDVLECSSRIASPARGGLRDVPGNHDPALNKKAKPAWISHQPLRQRSRSLADLDRATYEVKSA